MKRVTAIWTGCIMGGLLLFLSPFIYQHVTIGLFMRSNRKFLLKEVDHERVARACLTMLTDSRYSHLRNTTPNGNDSSLPPEIRDIGAFWLHVNSNSVLIVKTGGHYHTGYKFRPTSDASEQYELVFVEELAVDIPLARITEDEYTSEQSPASGSPKAAHEE